MREIVNSHHVQTFDELSSTEASVLISVEGFKGLQGLDLCPVDNSGDLGEELVLEPEDRVKLLQSPLDDLELFFALVAHFAKMSAGFLSLHVDSNLLLELSNCVDTLAIPQHQIVVFLFRDFQLLGRDLEL